MKPHGPGPHNSDRGAPFAQLTNNINLLNKVSIRFWREEQQLPCWDPTEAGAGAGTGLGDGGTQGAAGAAAINHHIGGGSVELRSWGAGDLEGH